jgi:hypothetical protein
MRICVRLKLGAERPPAPPHHHPQVADVHFAATVSAADRRAQAIRKASRLCRSLAPARARTVPWTYSCFVGERASVRQYSSTETGLVTCVLIPLPLFFDHRPPASSGGNPGGK